MRIVLTTDHPQSSYGVPVALIDGEAYGPADRVQGGMTAAAIVADWASRKERTQDDRRDAARYLRQWHDGPQIVDPAASALGSRRSEAKAAAARKNGARGGRPKRRRMR